MNGLSGFFLNGLRSLDYGIIMTKAPDMVFAERDVSAINVAGRSGDFQVDNGRYKNVKVQYQCAILPGDDFSLREAAVSAVELLRPSVEYARLITTYHPNVYRMARIASQVSIESIVEQAGTFSVTFDCKPQRFLVDGELPVKFSTPGSLYNPTTEIAQPLITIRGTGAGRLTVGDITVEIKQLEDQIILDSELQDAYRQVGEGAPENKNSCIYAPDFPVLVPGKNAISWTGGITSVEIIPRWWTL